MSVRIKQEDRTPLLELLGLAQYRSRRSSSNRAPDWEELKADIAAGEISYSQYIELRQIFTILNGTPLTAAQQLLSRARLFAIGGNELPSENFWQSLIGKIHQTTTTILDYAMMSGEDILFATYLETAMHHYHKFETKLDLIYTLRIQNDPIVNNWPGLAFTFRASPFVGLQEFVDYYAYGPAEDFFKMISFLRYVVANHQDLYMRFFALKAINNIFQERKESEHNWSMHEDYVVPFFEAGLKDRESIIVFSAWQSMANMNLEAANQVQDDSFSDRPTSYLQQSPEFGIGRYIYDDPFLAEAWNGLLTEMSGNRTYESASLSINQFSPVHSLLDYHPGPHQRRGIMAEKYKLLKNAIDAMGLSDRDKVLRLFFDYPSYRDQRSERILVLELPSGERFLYQGHHRIAALIKAAADGVIPSDWLDDIPVTAVRYNGDIPSALIRRVFTRGIDLLWTELFPAGTDFSNTPLNGTPEENPPSGSAPAEENEEITAADDHEPYEFDAEDGETGEVYGNVDDNPGTVDAWALGAAQVFEIGGAFAIP